MVLEYGRRHKWPATLLLALVSIPGHTVALSWILDDPWIAAKNKFRSRLPRSIPKKWLFPTTIVRINQLTILFRACWILILLIPQSVFRYLRKSVFRRTFFFQNNNYSCQLKRFLRSFPQVCFARWMIPRLFEGEEEQARAGTISRLTHEITESPPPPCSRVT